MGSSKLALFIRIKNPLFWIINNFLFIQILVWMLEFNRNCNEKFIFSPSPSPPIWRFSFSFMPIRCEGQKAWHCYALAKNEKRQRAKLIRLMPGETVGAPDPRGHVVLFRVGMSFGCICNKCGGGRSKHQHWWMELGKWSGWKMGKVTKFDIYTGKKNK